MRRYVFYIAIALSAFVIGSAGVYFVFYEYNAKDISEVKTTAVSETNYAGTFVENRQTPQPEFVTFKLKELPCEDKTLQIVWNELTDEFAEINETRAGDFKSCEDFLEVADFFQDDKDLDLNNDGVKEIFIRGIANPYSRCGNNCYTYWIFQKTGDKKYRKLFEAEGHLAIVQNKKTRGYKDIGFTVTYKDIVYSKNILFGFDGTHYIPKKCWEESKLVKARNNVDLVVGKKWKTIYSECKESEFITNYRNYSDRQ